VYRGSVAEMLEEREEIGVEVEEASSITSVAMLIFYSNNTVSKKASVSLRREQTN
jgi:hypothetical protein